MLRFIGRSWPVLIAASLLCACGSTSTQRKAGALDYLYPQGTEAQPPSDVSLELPVRVGIAFAPPPTKEGSWWPGDAFDEAERRSLLERVAAAFRDRPEIASVEAIPTQLIQPGGSFDNLDQIAAMLGIQVVALLSYDQVQFDDPGLASLTYWTIVGAYVIEGNYNDTRTMLDAAVFDIPSRALLFTAAGTSTVEDSATAMDSSRALRDASERGFRKAANDLITDLDRALDAFREQAAAGTVRGQGTPAITVTSPSGTVDAEGGGGGGAAALGGLELVAALLLALSCAGGSTGARKS